MLHCERQSGKRAFGGDRRTAGPLRGGSTSTSMSHGIGRVGRRVGGRREPIPGGLAAASMPRTPPPRLPTRPWTVSCGVYHGKSQTKAKAGRFARKAEAASQPPLLLLLPFFPDLPWWIGGRNLSVAGRVGCAGALAPWMARPSLQGRIHGVPCAAPPPGQPTEMQLFTTNQPHHGGAPPFADPRRRRALRRKNNSHYGVDPRAPGSL